MGVGGYPLKFDFNHFAKEYKAGQLTAIFDGLCTQLLEWTGSTRRICVRDFYIEGENAWGFLLQRLPGSGEADTSETTRDEVSEELMRAELIQLLADGRFRVEYFAVPDGAPVKKAAKGARKNVGTRENRADGLVIPVIPELSFLDEGKPWYQPSAARRTRELWSTDKYRSERQNLVLSLARRYQSRLEAQET